MEKWEHKWILISEEVQSKTVITAVLFDDIQNIIVTSREVNGKERRVFEYVMKNAENFIVPDEAIIISTPTEYDELMFEITKNIKI